MSARLVLIAFLVHAGVAAAADLGRLFFTPAQRATLDNARSQNIRIDIGTDGSEQQQQTAAPAPQNMSVNGIVRRSDGKSTVWVNNQPIGETGSSTVKVAPGKSGDRVKLTVPDNSRSVDLKVGQTVEILSGRIEESYSRQPNPNSEPLPADKPAATGATTLKPPATAPSPPRAPVSQAPKEPGQPQAEAGPAR